MPESLATPKQNPLALEFTLSRDGDGSVGDFKLAIDPEKIESSFYQKRNDEDRDKPIARSEEEAKEEIKKQFQKDFLRESCIIIYKEDENGQMTKINMADKIKELCEEQPEMFKLDSPSPENNRSHCTFDNAYNYLTTKLDFSEKKAYLALSSFTQAGLGGFRVFSPLGVQGTNMLINIDKTGNCSLKSSVTEYNMDDAMTRNTDDCLRTKCPSKSDIFMNVSANIGNVKQDDDNKTFKTKITISSSSQENIDLIKKLQQKELKKDPPSACQEISFKEQQNLCLTTLANFTSPESLVKAWKEELKTKRNNFEREKIPNEVDLTCSHDLLKMPTRQASSANISKMSTGQASEVPIDVQLDASGVHDHFKKKTLPLILQTIVAQGVESGEETKVTSGRMVSIIEEIIPELSGKDTRITEEERQNLSDKIEKEIKKHQKGGAIISKIMHFFKNLFKPEKVIYDPTKDMVKNIKSKLEKTVKVIKASNVGSKKQTRATGLGL